MDVSVCATGPVATGWHAERGGGCRIEAGGGTEAGSVEGVGHALAAGQLGLQPGGTQCKGVLPGCQAGNGLEDPVHMPGAEARLLGQRLKRWRRFGLFHMPAQGGDQGGMAFSQRWLIGLAAPARTKARRFRLDRSGEEAYVLGARAAGPTGRAAIHARGADAEKKLAVSGRVLVDDGVPARVTADVCRACGAWSCVALHGALPFLARVRRPQSSRPAPGVHPLPCD